MTAIAEPAAKAGPAPVQTYAESLHRIPLNQLHESSFNPRKHYDQVVLAELARSLAASGQLTPIIVRPRKGGGYEIAAGHRRFRAAKLASLAELTAIVRDLDEKTFIEVLNIENLQRDDLHPLEEAQGFADLVKHAGYDAAKIAARIGRSEKYVYDRLKLLQLTPEAQKLFSAGKFEAGHAILLARLSPADQKRAMGDSKNFDNYRADGGLFQAEHVGEGIKDGQLDQGDDDAYKARSVRELAAWINDNVRMKPEAIDPFLFPETAGMLQAAELENEKVVAVTYDYRIADGARDESERTYGDAAWKRADGKHKSKICDHSVIGLVAGGPGRGDSFRVCVNKKKCMVHWPEEAKREAKRVAAAKKVAKQVAKGDANAVEKAKAKEEQRKAKIAAEQKALELESKRWDKACPVILETIAEKVKRAPVTASSDLGKAFLEMVAESMYVAPAARKLIPVGHSAEDLIRHAVFGEIYGQSEFQDQSLKDSAEAWGVDWQKILDQEAPAEPKAKPAKKSKKKGA